MFMILKKLRHRWAAATWGDLYRLYRTGANRAVRNIRTFYIQMFVAIFCYLALLGLAQHTLGTEHGVTRLLRVLPDVVESHCIQLADDLKSSAAQ